MLAFHSWFVSQFIVNITVKQTCIQDSQSTFLTKQYVGLACKLWKLMYYQEIKSDTNWWSIVSVSRKFWLQKDFELDFETTAENNYLTGLMVDHLAQKPKVGGAIYIRPFTEWFSNSIRIRLFPLSRENVIICGCQISKNNVVNSVKTGNRMKLGILLTPVWATRYKVNELNKIYILIAFLQLKLVQVYVMFDMT